MRYLQIICIVFLISCNQNPGVFCIQLKHVGSTDKTNHTVIISSEKDYCNTVIRHPADTLWVKIFIADEESVNALFDFVKQNAKNEKLREDGYSGYQITAYSSRGETVFLDYVISMPAYHSYFREMRSFIGRKGIFEDLHNDMDMYFPPRRI